MDYSNTNDHYYRDRCKQLSEQLHETNHRHRDALREVRRSRLINALMKKLFRLKAARLSSEKIAARVLLALQKHLALECSAIYVRSSVDSGFRALACQGFPIKESCDLAHRNAMPEFACVDAYKKNMGISKVLAALSHAKKTLWCFNAGTGLALLLGSNQDQSSDSWDLSSEDREMLHAIMELVANAINEADARTRHTNTMIDEMTGLPSRKMTMDYLERESRDNQRISSTTTVLYLDVDRFACINQQFGHVVGDKVLIAIAHRLKSLIRPGDFIGRLGVDEFAIISPGLRVGCDAELIASRMLASFRKPLRIGGDSFYLSLSIGIAETCTTLSAVETFQNANVAMINAKSGGGAAYSSYGREMLEPVPETLRLESELRRAIGKQELSLFYQPIFSLHSNAVVALEALLRWHHPSRGILTPDEFIPLAQKSEVGLLIGDWVVDRVIRDMNIWSGENEASKGLSVCVNVDESQFVQQNFAIDLGHKLRRGGIDPQRFRVEISESTLQDCRSVDMQVLMQLREMGVKVMLDDFGTSSSSLERLHALPIDTIKIDKNFVAKIGLGGRYSALMKAMVSLAKNLDKQIVAEGAEDAAQLRQLKALGCDFAQGYLLGKPMAASKIGPFLGNQVLAMGRE